MNVIHHGEIVENTCYQLSPRLCYTDWGLEPYYHTWLRKSPSMKLRIDDIHRTSTDKKL